MTTEPQPTRAFVVELSAPTLPDVTEAEVRAALAQIARDKGAEVLVFEAYNEATRAGGR